MLPEHIGERRRGNALCDEKQMIEEKIREGRQSCRDGS